MPARSSVRREQAFCHVAVIVSLLSHVLEYDADCLSALPRRGHIRVAQPDQIPLATFVYLTHNCNLSSALKLVVLINTDGVNLAVLCRGS